MTFGVRSKPLKRTPFKRKAPLNTARMAHPSGSSLKPRSTKRAAHMRDERVPMVKSMIANGRSCEICPVLSSVGVPVMCAHEIQGLHERRKSSAGGSRRNVQNLIPACNWSNVFAEDNPALVRRLTGDRLVVREGDPEWPDLGARSDRLG
jgi:hypothetical protein